MIKDEEYLVFLGLSKNFLFDRNDWPRGNRWQTKNKDKQNENDYCWVRKDWLGCG